MGVKIPIFKNSKTMPGNTGLQLARGFDMGSRYAQQAFGELSQLGQALDRKVAQLDAEQTINYNAQKQNEAAQQFADIFSNEWAPGVTGANSREAAGKLTERLKGQADAMLMDAPSDDARNEAKLTLDSMISQYTVKGGGYARGVFIEWGEQGRKIHEDSFVNAAAQAGTPEAVDQQAAGYREYLTTRAEHRSLIRPDEVDAYTNEMKQRGYKAVIDGKMAVTYGDDGKPVDAIQALANVQPFLADWDENEAAWRERLGPEEWARQDDYVTKTRMGLMKEIAAGATKQADAAQKQARFSLVAAWKSGQRSIGGRRIDTSYISGLVQDQILNPGDGEFLVNLITDDKDAGRKDDEETVGNIRAYIAQLRLSGITLTDGVTEAVRSDISRALSVGRMTGKTAMTLADEIDGVMDDQFKTPEYQESEKVLKDSIVSYSVMNPDWKSYEGVVFARAEGRMRSLIKRGIPLVAARIIAQDEANGEKRGIVLRDVLSLQNRMGTLPDALKVTPDKINEELLDREEERIMGDSTLDKKAKQMRLQSIMSIRSSLTELEMNALSPKDVEWARSKAREDY